MSDLAQKLSALYTPHTVEGSWLIVLSFIAAIIGVALIIRVVFPIKPTALEPQHEQTLVEALSKEV